jgi:hypothetical protein
MGVDAVATQLHPLIGAMRLSSLQLDDPEAWGLTNDPGVR